MEIFSLRRDSAAMKPLAHALIERQSRPDRVAPRIFAIREHLALSKAQFADAIGLDRSSLTKIEKGEAGLDIAIAERIAAIFGFGLDFIYRGDLDDVPLAYRGSILSLMHTHRTTP